MKIKFSGCGHASEEAITEFERFLGRKLPESVKEFFRNCDGAEPEDNIFSVGPDNASGVREFIPLRSIPEEMEALEEIPGERAGLDVVESKAFPIAWDDCGNYVVVDPDRDGAVYFWDHELHDPFTKIADDFDQFLNDLAPFDPKSVKLDWDQVESVWIKPGFLESLKKK